MNLLRRERVGGGRSGCRQEASDGSLPVRHSPALIGQSVRHRTVGAASTGPAAASGAAATWPSATPADGRTRATLLPVTTPPRGREAGEIPAQSRYGDRRSSNGGSPVAGPAAEPHVPSRERGRQA
jgi:hypothetical protein